MFTVVSDCNRWYCWSLRDKVQQFGTPSGEIFLSPFICDIFRQVLQLILLPSRS